MKVLIASWKGTLMIILMLLPRWGVTSQPSIQKNEQVQRVGLAEDFDVTLVKPSDPTDLGFTMDQNPDSFTATGASLKFLIAYAYHLHTFQVVGGPEWVRSARFDVMGKMDRNAEPSAHDQSREEGTGRRKLLEARLRSLLSARFGLVVHGEEREMNVSALTLDKAGVRMQVSQTDDGYTFGPGEISCSNSSMSDLAWMLTDATNQVVLDQTKLSNHYVFSLRWSPDTLSVDDATRPDLSTALKELGLRLEKQKAPVPTLMIDRLLEPTKN